MSRTGIGAHGPSSCNPTGPTVVAVYGWGVLLAGEVVIVSGPPGSGKSTIAAALAESADRGVHLESDWFLRWIRSGFIPPHLPASHSQNIAVMDIVTDAAAGYATAGYVVVWDGIVGPWFLERVVSRLSARGVRVRYLVVRAERETALARVLERDGTTELSGAEVMWDQFVDLGELEGHVVSGDGDGDEVLGRCRLVLGLRADTARRRPPHPVPLPLAMDDQPVVADTRGLGRDRSRRLRHVARHIPRSEDACRANLARVVARALIDGR